jgi:hypothetical protein
MSTSSDNDASSIALRFVIFFWKLIARLFQVDIKDAAAAFVEGMRHNTHLQGLQYVP